MAKKKAKKKTKKKTAFKGGSKKKATKRKVKAKPKGEIIPGQKRDNTPAVLSTEEAIVAFDAEDTETSLDFDSDEEDLEDNDLF